MTHAAIGVQAPKLYRATKPVVQASVLVRFVALVVSVACLVVLLTAASLTPSPTGVGSHLGLGMQSCALLARTGIPCPTCGMTTSFSWFAHGNPIASFYVQPMGMLLALAAACSFWAGAYIAITGRPIHRLLQMFPSGVYLVWVLGFAIAAWGWKTFLQLRGLDGW